MVGLIGYDTGTWSEMGVSKKHFVASAKVIRKLNLGDMEKAHVTVELGTMFKAFNDNFDLARFFEAATGHSYDDYLKAHHNVTTED